jgi:hypothetical protein
VLARESPPGCVVGLLPMTKRAHAELAQLSALFGSVGA